MNARTLFVSSLVVSSLGALALSGCARDEEPLTQETAPAATPEDPGMLTAQAWIDEVELGGAVTDGTITMQTEEFAPGQPIYIAMEVSDAPAQADVTVQWRGPDDIHLAYETKTVVPGQGQLIFTQENTADWRAGDYVAQVWVGDEKVSEQEFQIVGNEIVAGDG